MKKFTRLLLLSVLFLSACTRAYPGSWPEISSGTNSSTSPTASPEITALPSESAVPTAAPDTAQPAQAPPAQVEPVQAEAAQPAEVTLTPVPTPLPAKPTAPSTSSVPVPVEFQQALTAFPLVSGDSWIYNYVAYSGDQTAVWQISDTVTTTRGTGRTWIASLERQVELVSGTPGADFINPPKASSTWLVVELGAEPGAFSVYRLDDVMNLDKVADSILEYVFPLSEGAACWFPDAATRQLAPGENTPGCRKAGASHIAAYPAGSFMGCVDLMTPYNDGAFIQTFCPTVGIAGGKYDHRGTPFGYSFELVAYLLQ